MTEEEFPLDYVDYTSIMFPSDQITIRDIRRAHAAQIDTEDTDFFLSTAEDTLAVMLKYERVLAREASDAVHGKNSFADREATREDYIDELTKWYVKYGVAQGREHTEQLVRQFEAQAVTQIEGRGR